jgi:hypothetical protein
LHQNAGLDLIIGRLAGAIANISHAGLGLIIGRLGAPKTPGGGGGGAREALAGPQNAPGRPGEAPGCARTPQEAPGKPGDAPGSSRKPREAPGKFSGRPGRASQGSPGMPRDAPGRLRRLREDPGGPRRPREAPGSPGMPREAPGSPRGRLEAQSVHFPTIWTARDGPGSPGTPWEAPESLGKPQEAPGSPREPQGTPGGAKRTFSYVLGRFRIGSLFRTYVTNQRFRFKGIYLSMLVSIENLFTIRCKSYRGGKRRPRRRRRMLMLQSSLETITLGRKRVLPSLTIRGARLHFRVCRFVKAPAPCAHLCAWGMWCARDAVPTHPGPPRFLRLRV